MNQLSCLTPDECLKIVHLIDKNRSKWLQISFKETAEKLPFFSLGVGVTYVATKRYSQIATDYHNWARVENDWMLNEFDWFYDKVIETLTVFLKAPVRFNPDYSIPGFHIFLYHQLFTQPLGIIHCDRQHLDLGISPTEADLQNPISFTVSLELPSCGSGIDFWDVHFKDIEKISYQEFAEAIRQAKHSYFPYSLGKMVIHSGYHAHRIAPVKDMQAYDRRITLQGHGVKLYSGEWIVYW